MRKLKLQVQMSIDGFIAGPNGEMDWVNMAWTDDINQYVGELVKTIDCIVLGRKLAEGFIPYWGSVAADASNPEQESGKLFTDTPKVVFSHTLSQSPWPNTEVAGNLVEEIKKLKSQDGKDLYACGGATFVSSLIRHGLIDDFHLFINPVAIGSGMPIFQELLSKQHLTLVKATSFDCGIVAMHYQPKKG